MYFLLVIGFIIIALGFFVFFKNPQRKSNLIFSLLCISLSFWVISSTAADLSNTYYWALFWVRAAIVGPFLFGFLFLIFSYFFPNDENPSIKKQILILTPLLFIIFLIPTKYNVESVTLKENWTDFTPGYLYTVLLIYFFVYIGFGFYRFIKKLKLYDGLKVLQIKYVLFGITLVVFFGVITNAILPFIGYGRASVFGPSSSIFFVICIAYAIVKFRLLDIRSLITRSIIFVLLVSLVTSAFALITYLLTNIFPSVSRSQQLFFLSITALIIVTSIDPIKKFLGIATNKIFFKAAINYSIVTKKLTDVINEEVELADLVKRFTQSLQNDLRFKSAEILLPVGESVFISPEELDLDTKKNHPKTRSLNTKSTLLQYLIKEKQIVILDEIDRKAADAKTAEERNYFDNIRGDLESMSRHAAVPIIIKNQVEAILILGAKKSGASFSNNDIQLLEVIAPQIASGIQKARLYQEAKEFNVKLEREVDIATTDLRHANGKLQELDKAKSEFMSIASHQLRTPLAGIIGYLDMMYTGDFGELKDEQKPIIHDVLDASQRLTRLVNTFLNVTRIEAGRFTINYAKIPFHELVDSMVKQLKPTADKKKITLNYTKSELPTVEVDIDKMKDVVGNLIDNAIKYTPEGSVTVRAEATTTTIHFSVKDTGIGIPKGEDKQLFNKFVRGEGIAQVNPNGSGLGLFIAKKVVEGHKGKIWAESEGSEKGTTFHVEIPIVGDPEIKKKAEEFAAKGTPTTTTPDTVSPVEPENAPEEATEQSTEQSIQAPEATKQPTKPKKSTKPRTRKPRKQK